MMHSSPPPPSRRHAQAHTHAHAPGATQQTLTGHTLHRAPTAPLQFVAALKRSLDVVLITEHIDESLLLLGRRAGWSAQDLLYISQKRRKQQPRGAGGAAAAAGAAGAVVADAAAADATDPSPAARAAASGLLHTATDWPTAAALRAPAAPWLWPHELDSVVRANWLDTLLHAHFNRTLWRRIDAEWPGARGGAALQAELARFRALQISSIKTPHGSFHGKFQSHNKYRTRNC